MIDLIKRILTVSGVYQKRILLAFVFSFLKSLLSKAPIMLAFLVLNRCEAYQKLWRAAEHSARWAVKPDALTQEGEVL